MKGNFRKKLEREENHLVRATVIVDGFEITDVPCKIFLPERIQEKPYIILKPTDENAKKIMASHKGSMSAIAYGFDKSKELTIETPKVYFSGSSTKYWGNGISDSTVPGEPQDLHVIHHYKDIDDIKHTDLELWISPNAFLTPSMSSTSSYTGDLEYKRVNTVSFELNNKINLVFDKHFRSKNTDNGDFIQWSFLVACVELEIPADDVNTIKTEILPIVDDFLLIASMVSRQRTACLGWSASDKSSHAMFYRGNYVFPETVEGHDIDGGVVEFRDFERFMQVSYTAFLKYNNKLALRNALYSVFTKSSQTLETSFLKKFAGLETLLLDFRRSDSLEFVLENDKWSTLKKYLQKCIKDSTAPKLDADQRASMYRKLDELNRISLRESFDIFCKNFSINLSDLWPVFGDSKLVGLVDIRNKLIHGDPLPNSLFGPLIVAKEHLNYVLERIIVRILNWDIEETKIKPSYLKSRMTVIKDMISEQEKLSDYILG